MRAPEGWPFALRQINVLSAGMGRFPDWALRAVPVTCGRGVTADAIAEFVLAAILGREKRLIEHARRGTLTRGDQLGGLAGRTVGLLGTGRIGQAVAARAGAFGMRVVGASRRGLAVAEGIIERVESPARVAALADHLVLALPLTPATLRIIDAAFIANLRPGAHLINVARGPLVDQEALLAALERGQVGFATLDVTEPEPLPQDHPLRTHPQVLITPHVSWSSDSGSAALQRRLNRDIDRFLAGLPPLDAVDPDQRY